MAECEHDWRTDPFGFDGVSQVIVCRHCRLRKHWYPPRPENTKPRPDPNDMSTWEKHDPNPEPPRLLEDVIRDIERRLDELENHACVDRSAKV